MTDYSIDIHTHTSLKPLNQTPQKTMWDDIPTSPYCAKQHLPNVVRLANIIKDMDSFSQSDLTRCQAGKVRVLFLSLYPVEKPMFDVRDVLDAIMSEKKERNLGACISGFSRDIVVKIIDDTIDNKGQVNYFEELEKEYQYVLQEAQNSDKLIIAGSYQEVQEALAKDEDSIVCLITIEGMHALNKFASYNDIRTKTSVLNKPKNSIYQQHLQIYTENIQKAKSWGAGGKHSPLFITFAHHFWNLLCGHAQSFGDLMNTLGINQQFCINSGFTELGKEVLKMLLDRSNGRRILIDNKHMSARAREDFYEIWKTYRANGDNFPIICSHGAVSGIATLADAKKQKDKNSILAGHYFNNWSINLTDEDIRYIFQSNGIIGLVLHEGRVPGGISKQILDHYREDDLDKMRDEYIRLLMSNIFHIVEVCNDAKAWDLISIGSDFDGIINSFDIYKYASDMPMLFAHMLQFLYKPIPNKHIGLTEEKIKQLMFGYTPEEIIAKIKSKNAELFMKRYFHDEYLKAGNLVV